jgi:hypothetical protein
MPLILVPINCSYASAGTEYTLFLTGQLIHQTLKCAEGDEMERLSVVRAGEVAATKSNSSLWGVRKAELRMQIGRGLLPLDRL